MNVNQPSKPGRVPLNKGKLWARRLRSSPRTSERCACRSRGCQPTNRTRSRQDASIRTSRTRAADLKPPRHMFTISRGIAGQFLERDKTFQPLGLGQS